MPLHEHFSAETIEFMLICRRDRMLQTLRIEGLFLVDERSTAGGWL